MKILLVYPFMPDVYHRLGFILPPLGLGYLAAVAGNMGHEVTILDLNVTGGKGLEGLSRYDLVGVTMDTSRYHRALEAAGEAMRAGARVVLGGPHATFVADDLLAGGVCHDVIRGEGEESFGDLLSALDRGDDCEGILGISTVKNGKIIHNSDRPPPEHLDALPFPDREIMGMDSYRRLTLGGRHITSMVTSRGCPHNCDFCSSSVFSGTVWRTRGPENITREIEEIVHRHRFGAVCFMDDNFTMNPERVIRICDEIEKRSLDIYWWCFSRSDIIVKNETMVRRMAETGCRYVFMGIESASDETLKQFGKRSTTDKAARAVGLLKKYDIETMGSFIIGWPYETASMVKNTIRYSKQLGLGGAQYSILTPYPGTKLYREHGWRIFEDNWEKFDCLHAVMRLDYLTPGRTERLLKRAFFSFYFTLKRIFVALMSRFRSRGVGMGTIKKIWEFFWSK
ncbi:MAG: B12-binding domain-containing radical SAM protein [Deltaproteobacteria bacterium]|nr:B12-binding domain-containing radical SAM protein [Candidatus Zymogenaceae bacterium]